MKRFFTILAFTLLAQLSFAQHSFNTLHYYTGDSTTSQTEIRSLIQLDSHLVMLINADSGSSIHGLSVVKTDLEGNLIKSTGFYSDSITYPVYPAQSILLDRDSNIVIVSSMNRYYRRTGAWDGFVAKLDRNLDTLWSRSYNLPDSLAGCDSSENIFLSVHLAADGGYIVTGRNYLNCDFTLSKLRSYIVKLNKNGDVQWRQMFNYSLSHIYDLVVLPDSGFALSEFPATNTDWSIVRTDSLGNILWREFPNNKIHYKSGAIDLTHDGHIVAMAPCEYDAIDGLLAPNVVKYDLNGNKLWDKKFITHYDFNCSSLHENHEILSLENGNVFIMGTVLMRNPLDWDGYYGFNGLSLMLNSSGDSLWSRYYHTEKFEDHCQLEDVILMDNGDFLAAGFHRPRDGSYGYGGWLLRMDSMGFAPGAQTLSISSSSDIPNAELTVYPNPAQDLVHVSYKTATLNAKLEAYIYSIDGRLLYSTELKGSEGEQSLDLSALPAGSYTLQLFAGKVPLATRKLNLLN